MKRILNFFKLLRLAREYKVPYYVDDVWYNYSCYSKTAMPKVFDNNRNYIPINKELLYVLNEFEDGKKAYYQITNVHYKSGSDYLCPSDAYHVDLKLRKIA